jgi:glyoxalase family protein
VQRGDATLGFADPEGLALELAVSDVPDEPLTAASPDVPEEHRLQGFDGVHAFSTRPEASRPLFEETLGFTPAGDDAWGAVGDSRRSHYAYDAAPGARGRPGAGTVHHVAWACPDADHEVWHERVLEAGAHVTPIIDRDYFKSIYFREPSGVLFEIATQSPGFTVDEPAETLGHELKLPKQHEHLREQLERTLTLLPDTR